MTREAPQQAQSAADPAPGPGQSSHRPRLRRRVVWLGLGAVSLAILAGGALAWLRPWTDPDTVWAEGEAELKANRIDGAEAASNRLGRLRRPTPWT